MDESRKIHRALFTGLSQSHLKGNVLREISEGAEGVNAEPLDQQGQHDVHEIYPQQTWRQI